MAHHLTSLLIVFGVLSIASLRCQAQMNGTGGGGIEDIQWYIWLILAVAAAMALFLIAVVVCFALRFCRRYRVSHSSSPTKTKVQREHFLTEKRSLHSLMEETDSFRANINWEISREKIRLLQLLGIGEFGAVFDAEVKLGKNMKSRALIKVFKKGTPQDLVLFWQEMEEVMRLQHPRVARLFGVVSQIPYYAVYELPVNGDLKTFLVSVKSGGTLFTVPQLLAMATEVASGMAYMESVEYVHRDIATRNCVVTQNLGVKIADYKVGRYLFRSEYAVQADGSLMPVRWMAPESLAENIFSLYSDVWSFGVLIWELLTMGQFPYTELTDAEVVNRVCYECQRLLQPVQCPENIYKVMLQCWHSEPVHRPSMSVLQQQLEAALIPPHSPPPPPMDTSINPVAQDAMQY